MKKIFMAAVVALLGICGFAKDFTVSIGAGTYWLGKNRPKVAIWLTDENNNYLKTLYVSPVDTDAEKADRAKVLYTWNSVAAASTKMDKGNAITQIDAVSTATKKGGTFFNEKFDFDPAKKYYVWAEVNGVNDYNDYYTKTSSPENGQPSVIYKHEIGNDSKEEIRMPMINTAIKDSKGKIIYGKTDKITTAKDIVKLIALTFEEHK